MCYFLSLYLFFTSFVLFAFEKKNKSLISIDSKSYELVKNYLDSYSLISNIDDYYLIEVDDHLIDLVSSLNHQYLKRCGGYFIEENKADFSVFIKSLNKITSSSVYFPLHAGCQDIVGSQFGKIDQDFMRKFIKKFTSFKNRYYKSEHGIKSQKWLHQFWSKLTEKRDDVSIEFYNHSGFPQPSVVLTIRGTLYPDEFVVLGGHGDSIAGWYPSNETIAPGADDNASGITALTEVLRLYSQSELKPKRSIQFISYAAEEVGLRGSQQIANDYRREGKDVKAVLQLDMTGHKGSEYDLVLISDYTTAEQNEFLVALINEYLPNLKWTYDQCGYACSDHASWYRNSYPVSFPFESTFKTYNKKIHTHNDTIPHMKSGLNHIINFSKLAFSFIVESSSFDIPTKGF